MATGKDTKPRKGISAKLFTAKQVAKARATRKRQQLAGFHDALRLELVHAKAITMTAVLATQGCGVHDNVSVALRGVVRRLDIVLDSLDEKDASGMTAQHLREAIHG
jgi:hypothetical protein